MRSIKTGRKREVNEIVQHDRAVQVGLLLLGKLNGPMNSIFHEDYINRPRRELKSGIDSIRGDGLRDEINKFCRNNFENLQLQDLAKLYEPLYEHGSNWRLPLINFKKDYGCPKEAVLNGAPLHSTVSLSFWGMQTEFPEMRLIDDIAVSFNAAVALEDEQKQFQDISCYKAKAKQPQIADILRRSAAERRFCILSCFNLVEAYINGIAWEYAQTTTFLKLTDKKKNLLTEKDRPVNIIEKIVKIPRIVAEKEEGPLHETRDPLKTFIETVKPYRDSIVHASPFSASERFGGYNKLQNLYEMNLETVRKAVEITLAIIGEIHRYLGGKSKLPMWVPKQKIDGTFEIDIFGSEI